MHQMVSANLDTSRRWWVLAIVVAAQFMFGVDAFIVNVAIPTIAVELHASPAQVEVGHRDLSDRLCDLDRDRRPARRHLRHQARCFCRACSASPLTSLWCGAGAVRSGTDRRAAGAGCDRGTDGAAGAGDAASVVLRCMRAAARSRSTASCWDLPARPASLLGGALVTLDLAGLGWRAVFLVNVPFGLLIIAAAAADHAVGAAPGRHAARHSRRDRAVYRDCSA